MVEMLLDFGPWVLFPIVLIITIVLVLKSQKPSLPSAEEQSIDYQHKEIDGLLGLYPDLNDFFIEAKGDGSTHAASFASEDVIKFYRTRDGEPELRNLVFIPAPRWYWGSVWRKCNEVPHYAIEISDKF